MTVVVVAPPSPPPMSEEGVRPARPKEVKASVVLREATPEEEEVEEDNPVGGHIGACQMSHHAIPRCVCLYPRMVSANISGKAQ